MTDTTHSHTFGQDVPRAGERRTLMVTLITVSMMFIEIIAGLYYGSMALLADGLHMGSHTVALFLSFAAYVLARRYAADRRFSFGTGKINTLAAFASALLLAVFALLMVYGSVMRFIHPVAIQFNQAIFVAVIGLIVNGASVFILGVREHDHDHHHTLEDSHPHHHHHHDHHHEDHNLRAAYFHVLADALTSILAIAALLFAKFGGWIWMDPMMGIVGAILVGRWSVGLLLDSGQVLLDRQAPESTMRAVHDCIEREPGNSVTDLHVWSIAPGLYACELTILSDSPSPPSHYKSLIPETLNIVHVNVEVHKHNLT
ncbi:CDF family Co(II)/Ni(II) efflux transporter DmeF [bacterium]|nr:CDF family Co(II)/Ni(II) efflux transporter DmeF [bacterium]